METNREINALMHLIDDPDEEVFSTVSDRIISLGSEIIPNLENLWENTPDGGIQERIESLIHRLHFQDLQQEITAWDGSERPDLLEGALLVSKYRFPDLHTTPVVQEVEKFRRNIWLELNSYLTALEQVNIVNKILFSYHKFKGSEISYQNQDEFLVSKVMEMHRGNSITNGIIYQTLCQMLDIPVRAVNIPRQFILAYFDQSHEYFSTHTPQHKIHFFIDPVSGQVYTQKDVENYFLRINVEPEDAYFKPMENRQIIRFLLKEYAKCFDDQKNAYKKDEIILLADILAKRREE